MSHFTVGVFHKKNQSVNSLMAPFETVLQFDPKDEESKKDAIHFARCHFHGCENASDEKCWEYILCKNQSETDDKISLENPEGKWDDWCVGGFSSGLLKIKGSRKKVNEGFIKDIDFSRNQKCYDASLDEWDVVVNGKKPNPDVDYDGLNKEDLLEVYHDRDTYAQSQANFRTFAVITPDGLWYEKGRLYMFGGTYTPEESRKWDDLYKERFLDTADPEWILSIVDCHV